MNKVSICNYRKSLKINLKQKVNELGSDKINDREMFMKGIDTMKKPTTRFRQREAMCNEALS